MKQVLSVLYLLVLITFPKVSLIFCEEQTNNVHLQFGVTDLLNLNGVDGSMISIKLDTSNRWSTRFGMSFSYEYFDKDEEEIINNEAQKESGLDNSFHIGISAIEMFYITYKNANKLYCGLGIGSYINKSTGKEEYSNDIAEQTIETSYIKFGIGPTICLGTEWRLHKHFAIFAEYSTKAVFSWYWRNENQITRTIEHDERETDSEYSDISIDNGNVILGLSFSF